MKTTKELIQELRQNGRCIVDASTRNYRTEMFYYNDQQIVVTTNKTNGHFQIFFTPNDNLTKTENDCFYHGVTANQPQLEAVDIDQFIEQIINGPTGLAVMEDREFMVHHKPDRIVTAAFVIRCLANPLCNGSAEVLQAIMNKRKA